MIQGFSIETVKFLYELKENNNKQWFDENRDRYRKVLLEPMQQLTLVLGPHMLSIDPLLEINPRRAISRINRDVRFSRDKSPYRPNMWIAFKRIYQDWKAEPVYFFEIFPDYYRYGMGFYSIPRETLHKLRDMIDEHSKEFKRIHDLYKNQSTFTIEGEKYKRIINPDLPADLNEWYQRKEIYLTCNRDIDKRLYSPELAEDLISGFKLLEPIYRFFLKLRNSQ